MIGVMLVVCGVWNAITSRIRLTEEAGQLRGTVPAAGATPDRAQDRISHVLELAVFLGCWVVAVKADQWVFLGIGFAFCGLMALRRRRLRLDELERTHPSRQDE